MSAKCVFDQLGGCRLIAVITIELAADAAPLTEALVAGGLHCAEVTFRTAAAADALEQMAACDELLVGAGTVLNVEQARVAMDRGARFVMSPGLNPKVVEYCLDHAMPIAPGVTTPTDIEMALEFGLDVLKFFPAEVFGGIRTLKAICGPYNDVRFIPTGGITEQNLRTYLDFPRVLACGGSWMVKKELISAHKFDLITQLVKDAVTIAH